MACCVGKVAVPCKLLLQQCLNCCARRCCCCCCWSGGVPGECGWQAAGWPPQQQPAQRSDGSAQGGRCHTTSTGEPAQHMLLELFLFACGACCYPVPSHVNCSRVQTSQHVDVADVLLSYVTCKPSMCPQAAGTLYNVCSVAQLERFTVDIARQIPRKLHSIHFAQPVVRSAALCATQLKLLDNQKPGQRGWVVAWRPTGCLRANLRMRSWRSSI
jgi:hypothetical protein